MGYADEILNDTFRVTVKVECKDCEGSRAFLRSLRLIDSMDSIYRQYGYGFVQLEIPVDLVDDVEKSASENSLKFEWVSA